MRLIQATILSFLFIFSHSSAATLTVQNNTSSSIKLKIQSAAAPWSAQTLASQQHTTVSFPHYFSVRVYPIDLPTHSITTVQFSNSLGFKPNPPFCDPAYRCDLSFTNPEQATLTISVSQSVGY